MRLGVKLPTREIGDDPAVLRAWAEAAEGLGFSHVVVIDHVLGVDPTARPDWADSFPGLSRKPPFVAGDRFDEPLVTLGFLAAVTTTVELVTGVLVLPQRQTALVAKQTAQVDVVSNGRLRLSVAVGWNPVEYEALGMDFHLRGRRFEEQIALLRELWTSGVVNFAGEFDHVVGAGITPLPRNQPIPLWIGGFSDVVMRRTGRLADGWYFGGDPRDELKRRVEIMREAASAAGRNPGELGVEGGVELKYGLDAADRLDAWSAMGATHVTIDPHGCGKSGAEHIELLSEVAARLPALRNQA
jgi:probable F420-dependent oxidoreductase